MTRTNTGPQPDLRLWTKRDGWTAETGEEWFIRRLTRHPGTVLLLRYRALTETRKILLNSAISLAFGGRLAHDGPVTSLP